MAGLTTAIIVGIGVSTAAGAYSSIQQGKFQEEQAKAQAKQMEMQMEAEKTQRAAEQLAEEQQRLARARQYDQLVSQQKVMAATSGTTGFGGSFAAMQSSDFSSYNRDQLMSQLGSNLNDSLHAQSLSSMRTQIRSTLRSGRFAARTGYINAFGTGVSGATDIASVYQNSQSSKKTS